MPRSSVQVLLLAFVCQLAGNVLGQAEVARPGDIVGQVRLPNNIPAPLGALILLERQDGGFAAQEQTDSQGRFSFRGLPRTSYRVSVRLRGYEPHEENVELQTTSHAYLQINLNAIPTSKTIAVPPEGAASQVSAHDAEVPAVARKEYEAGQKLLAQKKDAEGGIKRYRKAIELYDRYAEAHLALGLLYMDLAKFDEAQAELQKANELNPNAPGGYLALGAMFNHQKKYEDAEKVLSRGLELKADVPEGQYELAKTYWAIGKWQDAEPHAQKAVALAPTMAPVHVLLGNISLRRQDPLGAIKEFQEYLRLDPKGPMAGGVTQMIQKIEANQKK